jgi:hypothetical protein
MPANSEEEQAFWDWWDSDECRRSGRNGKEIWLAGIEWERKRLKSFHDTPEV